MVHLLIKNKYKLKMKHYFWVCLWPSAQAVTEQRAAQVWNYFEFEWVNYQEVWIPIKNCVCIFVMTYSYIWWTSCLSSHIISGILVALSQMERQHIKLGSKATASVCLWRLNCSIFNSLYLTAMDVSKQICSICS